MEWIEKRIRVQLQSGWRTVDAYVLQGTPWAVHRQQYDDGESSVWWTISHVPTGYACRNGTWHTLASAKRIAEQLHAATDVIRGIKSRNPKTVARATPREIVEWFFFGCRGRFPKVKK